MRTYHKTILLLFFFAFFYSRQEGFSQDHRLILQQYLESIRAEKGLSKSDISDWKITNTYTDKNALTYSYLHQCIGGIRIFNAVSPCVIKNNQVTYYANRFYPIKDYPIDGNKAKISETDALQAALEHLQLKTKKNTQIISTSEKEHLYIFHNDELSKKDIRIELVYLPNNRSMRLCYDVSISPLHSSDWWNIRIDAQNGQYIEKNNWTLHCSFEKKQLQYVAKEKAHTTFFPSPPSPLGLANYRAFQLPVESPAYGNRSLITDPQEPIASPYGWHDTNGALGAEYTITRGNNVYAYEDRSDANSPGYSPDGGGSLNFDFPMDLSKQPLQNQDAVITNLFYVNNMMHDILYQYGFTEAAGNFQQNNYGKGGSDQDHVYAEAQDGGGKDNANFSTPSDGQSGIMQMYLWSSAGAYTSHFTVNSPSVIAGNYFSEEAGFGPSLSNPLTSDIILVNDGVGITSDGCTSLQNAAAITGKIALIDRGSCTFTDKVLMAQSAGALAVVIVNNVPGNPFTMSGSTNPNIPAYMISMNLGTSIKNELNVGNSVNVTLGGYVFPPSVDLDGSLDNGIVAHEYGHGLSIRLSGGASNSNCLQNAEQAGEGWSDWLALMTTMKNGDQGTDARGIGNYAISQLPTDGGIRRYPYSTDKNINPENYSMLASSGGVHDIGEIWCSALWDLTWKLVSLEGFDADLYQGKGGNNTALSLVIQGLKLQPCDPGFLDSRDAILAADNLLFNGKYKCLIWEAFAGRGMGASASQGSPYSTGDEMAAYDLPPACMAPPSAPQAMFHVDAVSKCTNTFQFYDQSTSTQLNWNWDFGDTTYSNLQNPSHTYLHAGTYQVVLKVNNSLGTDYDTLQITYAPITAPIVLGNTMVCAGDSTLLTVVPSAGNTVEWMMNGIIISKNTSIVTPPLQNNTNILVHEVENYVLGKVGPADPNFGTGGFHYSGFEGKEYFTTFVPLKIKSAWLKANGDGIRTINLYDANEQLIQANSIFIPNDSGRIMLNIDIPQPGNYSLGVSAYSNLYRNNASAQYPYMLSNILSITGSNATGAPQDFYYYLYDWLVEEDHCIGDTTKIQIQVINNPLAQFNYSAIGNTIYFSDLSTGNPQSWLWHFGDGDSSTLQNPIHTYQQNGSFIVTLSTSNANCQAVTQQKIDILNVGIDNKNTDVFPQIYPSVSSQQTCIYFGKQITEKIQYRILSNDGRTVYSSGTETPVEKIPIDISNFSNGIYFVQIKTTSALYQCKFAVMK